MRVRAASLLLVVAACADEPAATAPDAAAPLPRDADAAAPPDARHHACAPARAAGHQTFACPDGVRADVEASAACVDGGCGLILDVHGYTMSADVQDEHTRMRALAPARGYVVVQPSAPGAPSSWGLGERDGVVWDLVLATIDAFAIDPDRVHVTGFSQGGMMSFRLACAHADRIASIAPVAGGGCFAGAAPSRELPILYLHGHLDTIVPWATVAVPQRAAILAAWDFGEAEPIAAGARHAATRWTTASGTVFEMWEHDYATGDLVLAGHCLTGPDDDRRFRCDGTDFDQTALILDFFDDHPRTP